MTRKNPELKITAEEALKRADILFARGDEAEAREAGWRAARFR